ncbi:MAG: DUF5667 domain-containing protein [candidate division WOR-3 bacterium]
MKLKVEEVLDQLLKDMAKGRDVNDKIKEYPEYEDELRELLQIAKEFTELPRVEPDERAITRTVSEAREIFYKREKLPLLNRFFVLQPALSRVFAVIIIAILVFGSGLLFSSRSMPGDVLYPFKRFSEKIQYSLTLNLEGKTALHIKFADRRKEELVYSFNKNRKIDETILITMLGETENAYNLSQSLNEDRTLTMLKRIAEVNEAQMEILKNIKPNACACDTVLINQALEKCNQRCRCLEERLNSKSIKSTCPYCGDSCTCW